MAPLRCSSAAVAFCVAGLTLSLIADAKLAKTAGDTQATFVAIGPAGMRIEGKTAELAVGDDGQNVTVSVPLNTMTTGISLRDRHMKEKYLEVNKYPNAELQIARSALKFPGANAEVSASAPGTIKIHGVSKPVTVTYTAKQEAGVYKVTGSTRINLKDFGVEVPSYLGVTVKPDVDINVRFNATDS